MTRTYQKTGKQIHWEIRIGWLRLVYFRLGKKITIRFELSKGWDN